MMFGTIRILSLALSNLSRYWMKTIVIVMVYALLVGLLTSVLLFVDGLDHQAHLLLSEAPELVVQSVKGGRHELTPVTRAEEIEGMRGVKAVQPRVWGYSFDPPTESTFTFWGADSVPQASLEFGEGRFPMVDEHQVCVVGQGVADLRFLGLGDRLPIKRADGGLSAPRVIGIFSSQSALLTNDLVVMPTMALRRIFDMDATECTDIAVQVHNPMEINTVAAKIAARWPDTRVITRAQILQTYDAAFDWRGGVWAGFLMTSILAFSILVWDKATGLTAEEVRTIGVLKAVGWSTRDVLQLKFWEGIVVSIVSVLAGLCFAEIHLVFFGGRLFAPTMKGWSSLYPEFRVVPDLDPYVLLTCIFLAVAPYVVVNLIPSWRASIVDPDTLMRG